MGRAGALRLAGGEGGPEPDAAELPEVFVISVDLAGPGDGLGLLSELRARPATRHAAILVALSEASRPAGPMALDLGASDLIVPPGEPEEMALRIAAQLRRARANEAMRRRLHEGLQMAMTDPLTGLPNRRYALSHAARAGERAARRGTGLAVLLLDLDRFKAVNDAHGHAAGDAVLRAVAGRLKGALRAVDLLARIGGEEFLAVLPEVSPGEALDAAERLRQAVGAAPVPLPGGGSVVQTVSVGVACATAHDAADSPGKGDPDTPAEGAGRREAHAGTAPDMDSLMRRADAALYAAKAAGRDRVHDASRKGEAGVAAA
jgi:two-component system cell cycle response regulator